MPDGWVAEGCGVSVERRRDQGGAAVCQREVAAGLEEFGGEVGEFGAFAHA
jgi:hypothetical protein